MNKDRKAIVNFRKLLRSVWHQSIVDCYHAYNRKGGAIIPLQNGETIYFPRACVLAIYADQPAAVKCSGTGSACPVCYTEKAHFALPLGNRNVLRTDMNMTHRQVQYHIFIEIHHIIFYTCTLFVYHYNTGVHYLHISCTLITNLPRVYSENPTAHGAQRSCSGR